MKSILSCLIVGCCLTMWIWAKELQIEPDQKYLLLDTTKTSTMQKELTEAASQGFRVVVGGVTSGSTMGVLMQRIEDNLQNFEYRLLATSKANTMKKEMNEAGAEGFKLIPTTLAFKEQLLGPAELVLVMEHEPKTAKRFNYRLFSASGSEDNIRNKLADAVSEGYAVVGLAMTPFAGAQVIAEQESDGSTAAE